MGVPSAMYDPSSGRPAASSIKETADSRITSVATCEALVSSRISFVLCERPTRAHAWKRSKKDMGEKLWVCATS
jgi:hypothetical protein